jgi:uncharacterized protein
MSEQEYFREGAPASVRVSAWIISDGTVGMEIQSRGLATALGLEPEVKRVNPRLPWRVLPASLWVWPLMALGPDSDPIEPPWPDLLIGTGRIAAAISAATRAASAGKTLTVQMQNPHLPPERFDLIVVPEHDGFAASNAITTLGSIHAITPARLQAACAAMRCLGAALRASAAAAGRGAGRRLEPPLSPDARRRREARQPAGAADRGLWPGGDTVASHRQGQ